jgi:SpoIID/LytB domain protein
MEEPEIQVGLLSNPEIQFTLQGNYHVVAPKGNPVPTKKIVEGEQCVYMDNGLIQWNGDSFKELLFFPIEPDKNLIKVKNVMIGKQFHWQQQEDQSFQGTLHLIIEEGKITAINIISTERYLTSVISSEMSAMASIELLKAHAVISRSWLLAQLTAQKNDNNSSCGTENDEEIVRWYNRSAHQHYDVCADDHCQRYQGVTKVTTDVAKEAVEQTRGEILIYNGEICDTRFSKCCGGITEIFSTCWEDKDYPYLTNVIDPYCGMADQTILSQVMVNYDQQTTDFYRWTITYSQQQLHDLIMAKTGIDFGDIIDLEPLARGTSGRIFRLKIVGSKRSLIIGKELEIRKTLSTSHLFSSAFEVKKQGEGNVPEQFTLEGAGWGHGVGLCQIGAAVMGEKGFKYKEILLHYYQGAKVERMY